MASFQLLSSTNGDLVASRNGSGANVSDPVQTDRVISTAAAGIIDRVNFGLRPPTPVRTGRLLVIASVSWQVTVGGAAGSTGRVNFAVRKNGADIPGATKGESLVRAIDAPGGPFRDTLIAVVPHGTLFDADDVLELVAELEVVNPGGVGNATIRIHHDPTIVADSFPVEMPPVGEPTIEHFAVVGVGIAPSPGAIEPSNTGQTFSTPVQTDEGINTALPPGVQNDLDFECRPAQPLRGQRVDVLAFVPWEVTAAGAVGSTGRINLTALLNGVAIPGVVVANGTTRAIDGIAGPFAETLHIVIPEINMDLDDRLIIRLQTELVVAGGAGAATMQIHHDPQTPGDELFVEAIILS